MKVNDKQTSKKVPIVANQNRLNEEIYFNNNRSPPIVFNRSNSSLKRSENTDQAIKSYKQNFEEKDHNKIIMRKYTDDINKAASLPEITEKDIITSHLYQDLKKKYQEEKDRTLKMKRLLHEKDSEITTHKQDKLQMYNKIAMMEEQIRNYEVAFEERSKNLNLKEKKKFFNILNLLLENNVEVAFPDFQSLLLALRYSGGHNLIRSRTPVREEMNPDHMTYEVILFNLEIIFSYKRNSI